MPVSNFFFLVFYSCTLSFVMSLFSSLYSVLLEWWKGEFWSENLSWVNKRWEDAERKEMKLSRNSFLVLSHSHFLTSHSSSAPLPRSFYTSYYSLLIGFVQWSFRALWSKCTCVKRTPLWQRSTWFKAKCYWKVMCATVQFLKNKNPLTFFSTYRYNLRFSIQQRSLVKGT